MNIIYNNPYRILGVYANSRRQEILANKGKATAFLKVGKVVEYPLDLKGILPPIARSVEMLSEAESHLALAKEQLGYVQFWFLKMTPIDDIAFNNEIDYIYLTVKRDNTEFIDYISKRGFVKYSGFEDEDVYYKII